MTIIKLLDVQEGLDQIELTGQDARNAYNRILKIVGDKNVPDVIYVGGQSKSEESISTYHIKNSTVFFRAYHSRDVNAGIRNIQSMRIAIASNNPEYREESLSRLEQIMEMRLREEEKPAAVAANC